MERIWTTILYLCVGVAFATAPVRGPPEGDDLLRYTTVRTHAGVRDRQKADRPKRPEIRPPKLEIIRAEPESTPGYWFVAPYVDVRGGDHDSRYIPFQVGPHIYRSDGVSATINPSDAKTALTPSRNSSGAERNWSTTATRSISDCRASTGSRPSHTSSPRAMKETRTETRTA